MPLRIRVSTRAAIFEQRKEQHIRLGYRIEDERPTPVNGLCSFTAVKEDPATDSFDYMREPEVGPGDRGACDATLGPAQTTVTSVCRASERTQRPPSAV